MINKYYMSPLPFYYLDSGRRLEIEKQGKLEMRNEYLGIRSLLNIDLAIELLKNFYNFVKIGNVYESSHNNKSFRAPTSREKNDGEIKYESKQLIGVKVIKGDEGNYYRINLYLLINFEVELSHYRNLIVG